MAIDSTRTATEPRSRRAILAGAIGGLAGLIAGRVASPDKANAAAGDPLLIGNTSNNAGTTNTTLTTSSTGTALLVTQNGAGTALRGSAVGAGSIAGFFTANNGTGISGVTGAGGSYGVFAQNNGAAGTAGALRATGGNNHGIVATTGNNSKYAITASNTAATGAGAAIQASGANNTGLIASTDSGGGRRAVMATNSHTAGVALEADGGTAAGVGVLAYGANALVGRSSAQTYAAIYGAHDAGAGANYGVYGSTASSDPGAVGLYGTASSGYGVVGDSTTGTGVTGSGTNGVSGFGTYAVYGETVDNIGVWGAASGTGLALYGSGDGEVTGAFSKASGSFKIDHPLDPANKFLYHSFVESPDMKNVYDGVATINAKGEATVQLPEWFGALNKDFRYQLTAIGPSDRVLYVKSEVKGNAFAIGGGRAGQRVSWQVTGVRKDAWANAHRIVVEQTKPTGQKGRYLHPAENGQPASRGIDYAQRQAIRAARSMARPWTG